MTTVPAVEDAIVAALQSRAGLTDVLVDYGLPAELPDERERIYLIDLRDLRRDPSGTRGARTEAYDLRLLVETHLAGEDRATVRARMWTLVGEIESGLAEDPELGGASDEAVFAGVIEASTLPTTDGWIGKALVRVAVEATR